MWTSWTSAVDYDIDYNVDYSVDLDENPIQHIRMYDVNKLSIYDAGYAVDEVSKSVLYFLH